MKKRSDKTILIEPSKTWQGIACSYISYFDRGYTTTIGDIAEYLRCRYNYVSLNIAWDIPHIYINSKANSMLYRYYTDTTFGNGIHNETDQLYFDNLITKKILFHWDDVTEYFLNNLKLVSLDGEVLQLDELPTLVSAKDLLDDEGPFFRFKYRTYLDRRIKEDSIPKVRFKNLVRYRWTDLEKLDYISSRSTYYSSK